MSVSGVYRSVYVQLCLFLVPTGQCMFNYVCFWCLQVSVCSTMSVSGVYRSVYVQLCLFLVSTGQCMFNYVCYWCLQVGVCSTTYVIGVHTSVHSTMSVAPSLLYVRTNVPYYD